MTPLGVTLNNPGNIRRTTTVWRGQDMTYAGDYCKFEAPEWGFRAMAKILESYEARGIHTLREAISTWAPPSENPTGNYIENVSAWTGIDQDTQTALATLPILKSMSRQEQGGIFWPDSTILLGITLANPQPET